MNTTDPSDLAPLSVGPGLAFGLFLILGLPTEPRQSTPAAGSAPSATSAPTLHSVGRESSSVNFPPRDQFLKRRASRSTLASR